MTSLDELDDRLGRAGSEIAASFAAVPVGDAGSVIRRARRRRAATGLSAAVAVVVVAAAMVAGVAPGTDGERQLGVASGPPSVGPATTVGGSSEVGSLDHLPALALGSGSWQLYEATERSGEGGGAGGIPSRHVRYVNGAGGVLSLDLFAVPIGSSYESIVSLLSDSGGRAVEVRGQEGRIDEGQGTFSVAWRESGTTIASLAVSGVSDEAEVLALAESFAPIDASVWQAMVAQGTAPDGTTATTLGG